MRSYLSGRNDLVGFRYILGPRCHKLAPHQRLYIVNDRTLQVWNRPRGISNAFHRSFAQERPTRP